MNSYEAPLRDMKFALFDVLQSQALFDRLRYGSLGPEDPVDVVVREHTPGVEPVAHREKTIEVGIEGSEVPR